MHARLLTQQEDYYIFAIAYGALHSLRSMFDHLCWRNHFAYLQKPFRLMILKLAILELEN